MAAAESERVLEVTRAAFPDEDLAPLVGELVGRADVEVVVAGDGGAFAILTECSVAPSGDRVGLLGPVAVVPGRQRGGLGSEAVREALRRAAAHLKAVIVLGDPKFYGRFGFSAAHSSQILAPYELPAENAEAWMAVATREGAALPEGQLVVPEPWRKPELWR